MKLHITMLLLAVALNLKSQLDSSYRILDKEAAFYKAYFANNKLRVMGLKIEKNGNAFPFNVQVGASLKPSNIVEQKTGVYYQNYSFSENALDHSCFIAAYNFNEIYRNFIKFDSLGNIVFKIKISSDTLAYVSKIIQTSDGGYLITGYCYNSSYTYNAPLIKINSKGTLDWVKIYNLHPYYDFLGYGLYETNNSYYVLFSKEKRGLSNPSLYDGNYSILKISSKGDSIKSWIGNKMDVSIGGSDLFVDKDENIIFSGNKIDSIVLDTPNQNKYFLKRTYLCSIDKSNKLIWEKTIGETSSVWTYLSKIKQLKDGNILAVGMNYNISKTDYCYYGYIIKMTKAGQVIWEKNYKTSFLSNTNRDNFEDFVEHEDETITVVGSTYKEILKDTITNPLHNRRFGWAVRLNKNGVMPKEANSGVNIVAFAGFDIFPNPSSNSIQITKERTTYTKLKVNIYTLDGRLNLSNTLDLNHSTIDIQNLPKGIYQVELIDDENKSYYKKLIKE